MPDARQWNEIKHRKGWGPGWTPEVPLNVAHLNADAFPGMICRFNLLVTAWLKYVTDTRLWTWPKPAPLPSCCSHPHLTPLSCEKNCFLTLPVSLLQDPGLHSSGPSQASHTPWFVRPQKACLVPESGDLWSEAGQQHSISRLQTQREAYCKCFQIYLLPRGLKIPKAKLNHASLRVAWTRPQSSWFSLAPNQPILIYQERKL